MKSIATSHSSTPRRSIAKESPKCEHGVLAKLQTARKGSRVGHRFYGCGLWPVSYGLIFVVMIYFSKVI